VICEICERRECDEPWVRCNVCRKMIAECRKSEEATRKKLREEAMKLIGQTTPGMKQFGCSVHERRGRKILKDRSHIDTGDLDDELE